MTYIDEEENARDKKLAKRAKPEHDGLKTMLEDHVWGLCCNDCDGGGWDYPNNKKCNACEGRGIHSWEYDDAVKKLESFIHQKELEAREEENKLWQSVAENIVEKHGVYTAVNFLNQRFAQLNKEREGK